MHYGNVSTLEDHFMGLSPRLIQLYCKIWANFNGTKILTVTMFKMAQNFQAHFFEPIKLLRQRYHILDIVSGFHHHPQLRLARSHEPFPRLLTRTLSVNIRFLLSRSQAMSYVPPHLRNPSSSISRTSKPTETSAVTLDDTHRTTNNLSYSSTNSHLSHSNASSSPSLSRWASSNAAAVPRTPSVPEPVFPQWKPSDRVFLMKPEQV